MLRNKPPKRKFSDITNGSSSDGSKRTKFNPSHGSDDQKMKESGSRNFSQSESQDEEQDTTYFEDDDDDLEDDLEEEEFMEEKFVMKRKYNYDDCARPKPPKINENKTFTFQQIDADYTLMYCKKFSKFSFAGRQNGKVPVIRFFGVTESKNSVLCRVWGFTPYFYAQIPSAFNVTRENVAKLGPFLNNYLEKSARTKRIPDANFIERIEIVSKCSMWRYQFNKKKQFFKIYTGIPPYVPAIRKVMEQGILFPGIGMKQLQTYESNVLFVLRCMIDKDIHPCSWIDLRAGKYEVTRWDKKNSHCCIEVDVNSDCLVSHEPVGEYQKIAPFRILSFDIECLGYRDKKEKKNSKKKKKKKRKLAKLHFAKAEIDECHVTQIANTITIQGDSEPIIKNVFCLGSCADISGAEVYSFENEHDLLLGWREFIEKSDPDIITGYNIINFDIPYLLDRAKFLQKKNTRLSNFTLLGRIKNQKSGYRITRFSSKQMGTRATRDINIKGRVMLDVLNVVLREYKLSSYKLNNVSSLFLGQQKEDVHYSVISQLQEKDKETRKRLALYCLKDALLPQRLIDKLMIIYNTFEMSRVCGITLKLILERGQQIKVVSQLLRKAIKKGLIMPTIKRKDMGGETAKFTGATVLQPISGFYQDTPISTLDFASLYPSIMIAHNLCYTTLVPDNRIHEFKPEDIVRTPIGSTFVKSHVAKGLLPEILYSLLDARKKAKKELKSAKDAIRKAVLNGRQLALKISANSVYGFTGAARGQLPCVQISSSVTSFGRQMIEDTKNWVEKKYCISNGFQWNAQVIYGDTDSVMIKFGTNDIKESIDLGVKAGKLISKELFVDPIRLEFEKVYSPYLLLTKKHYAGLLYTRPEKYDKIDTKGIETVRRDRCVLVRNLLTTCLHLILVKKDTEKALKYVKKTISALLRNQLDISLLVITKTLSLAEYKNKQPHSELAKRLEKRNPATAPKQGDRVMYAYIKKGKDAKDFEKSEDPAYILKNNLPIDTQYYLEKRVKPSITRLFSKILTSKQLQDLFVGKHTRKIVIPTPKNRGIMKYAKKKILCLGCKKGLKKDEQEQTICNNCEPKTAEIYEKIIFERNHYENLYTRAFTYCQRCQASLHQKVLCMNEDCPIYFMRNQVKTKLNKAEEQLTRFGDLSW